MNATDAIRAALRLSYDWNRSLAEDMRDAAMTFPTPNGGNHPTWVVGHAVHARTGLLSMISGETSPFFEKWDAALGGGSQPTDEPAAYPSYEELLAAWELEHRRTLDALDRIGEVGLDRPPATVPDELKDSPDFATVGRIFLFIAMHEMSHRGQLADARRAAGRSTLAF